MWGQNTDYFGLFFYATVVAFPMIGSFKGVVDGWLREQLPVHDGRLSALDAHSSTRNLYMEIGALVLLALTGHFACSSWLDYRSTGRLPDETAVGLVLVGALVWALVWSMLLLLPGCTFMVAR